MGGRGVVYEDLNALDTMEKNLMLSQTSKLKSSCLTRKYENKRKEMRNRMKVGLTINLVKRGLHSGLL